MCERKTASCVDVGPIRVEDLTPVVRLERTIQRQPWRVEHFAEIVDLPGGLGFVATSGLRREIIGYAVGWVVADEAELANLGVAVDHRRRGVGRRLVAAIAAAARLGGGRRMYLEVRRSNEGAVELYRSLGFQTVGHRSRYYVGPCEDARVMAVDLTTAVG